MFATNSTKERWRNWIKYSTRDYQESVTAGQTNKQTDDGQSDPYMPLHLAGDTKNYNVKVFQK